MPPAARPSPGRILTLVAGALVLKVTAAVVSQYGRYIPPDFSSDFLHGREGYFFGPYRWAFLTHILAGPITLVLGLFLVGDRFRARSPRWHRWLGRVQVAIVVLFVAPSGLMMAPYAAAGPVAAVGLAALAIATATCAVAGTRAAIRRRFADHRRWMWRCYLLLASAVVLRMMGGLATVAGWSAPWFDPLATWACWLGPLAIFEWRERAGRGPMRDRISTGPAVSDRGRIP
ncbi:DUF2306 domain-containing protein [Tundrisphaera sp. TA3]|uniref:DUF2306 domain-containing protein n=1 Tax=Tundrisphaera sp. TA3 TaxID=3435775 RepID=UPI003EBA22F9